MDGGDKARARRGADPDVVAPDGSEIRLLLQGARSSLVEVTLPAGQVSRPVRHRTVEEAWYVLDGGGRVWRCPPGEEPGSAVSVSPGDALIIPTGWSFQFAAAPDTALRFLCHTVPPWPGEGEAVPVERGGLGEATV